VPPGAVPGSSPPPSPPEQSIELAGPASEPKQALNPLLRHTTLEFIEHVAADVVHAVIEAEHAVEHVAADVVHAVIEAEHVVEHAVVDAAHATAHAAVEAEHAVEHVATDAVHAVVDAEHAMEHLAGIAIAAAAAAVTGSKPQLKAAGFKPVRVQAAPEPSDIEWENLHVKKAYRRRMRLFNVVAVLLVMAFSTMLQLIITLAQAEVARSLNSETAKNIELEGDDADKASSSVEFIAQSASLAAAVITFISNWVLKRVCTLLTKKEKNFTVTGYETGLYMKLASAYAVNTCVVPFLARLIQAYRSDYFTSYTRSQDAFFGTSDGEQQPSVVINQDWFESNGFTGYIFISLIGTSLVSELAGMFRPKSLFNRYIRSHFITSQHKLNRLWKPPRMPVGRLYANVVKDVSLCIVYGPIFPLAYLLTAVRLALSFWTNLFTITYFFGRPAALTEKMMNSMTNSFFCMCLMALATKYFAYENAHVWPLIAAAAMLLCFYLSTLCRQVLALDEYSQLDVVDTQLLGVRYDEVPEKLGVELDPYQCPRMRVKGGREHLQSESRKKLRRASLKVEAVEALTSQTTAGAERRKSASEAVVAAAVAAAAVAAVAEAPSDRAKSIPPKRQIQSSSV